MPVNVTRDPAGNVVVTDEDLGMARVLTKDEFHWWPGPRYMPHWRTCPNASEHRRRARRPA